MNSKIGDYKYNIHKYLKFLVGISNSYNEIGIRLIKIKIF